VSTVFESAPAGTPRNWPRLPTRLEHQLPASEIKRIAVPEEDVRMLDKSSRGMDEISPSEWLWRIAPGQVEPHRHGFLRSLSRRYGDLPRRAPANRTSLQARLPPRIGSAPPRA